MYINAFAKKYKDKVNAFMHYMCELSFWVESDFKDFGELIEKDACSIVRYTNLLIYFEKELQE